MRTVFGNILLTVCITTVLYLDYPGRLPGILDIYGTGGGLPQHRAALLASRGFAVLTLAVFAYDDLPKKIEPGLDLEYFLVKFCFIFRIFSSRYLCQQLVFV